MYDNTERLDTIVSKLTPNERTELMRAVEAWTDAQEDAQALEPLQAALLRAQSNAPASCMQERPAKN